MEREREGLGEGRWVEDEQKGVGGSWYILGPCADHHEEVATGYKAVFIDTSPNHLPPKLWHKKSLPFL